MAVGGPGAHEELKKKRRPKKQLGGANPLVRLFCCHPRALPHPGTGVGDEGLGLSPKGDGEVMSY